VSLFKKIFGNKKTPQKETPQAKTEAVLQSHQPLSSWELDSTQQASILKLARAGSTQFALSEYSRLDLDKIRNHEDIMALHGRLYKDLFLSQSGKEALESAQRSAEKYEAAFKDTQGFYSGINAATMSLLAGFPKDMVKMRAKRIVDILPATEELDSETKYFVEATRAEAQLLLDDITSTQQSMRTALNHDPLNFTAHASTLKQFRMIAAHRGENYNWLTDFRPPIAVHFAGHMFGVKEELDTDLPCLTQAQIDALKIEISELIQMQDIGFGYGALAAGADILIAEAILEEGGELHVTLPVNQAFFIEASVKPYGYSWVERFETCLSRASSVRIVSAISSTPNTSLEKQASLSSMGAAIRHAESLSVPSAQLLIWNGKLGFTGTAADAGLWKETERPQYIIPYEGSRTQAKHVTSPKPTEPLFVLRTFGTDDVQSLDDLQSAMSKALEKRQSLDPQIKQVLDYGESAETKKLSAYLLDHALPGSIILSDRVANQIAVHHFKDYSADLIGSLETGDNIYALREKGSSTI